MRIENGQEMGRKVLGRREHEGLCVCRYAIKCGKKKKKEERNGDCYDQSPLCRLSDNS